MGIIALVISWFTIVELNCENLFDCRHDSLKQDTEFTPEGNRKWTVSKYWKKVNNIAQTLMSCGEDGQLPDLIALCEVENDSVVRDLSRRSPLRAGAYEYVMTDSRDPRGIDVALLYSRPTFRPIASISIRPEGNFEEHPPRDLLYTKGIKIGGDTLHVFVVHAPSRIGGKKSLEHRRMATIQALTNTVDSIFHESANANIIIAGDFNATADELPLITIGRHRMVNASLKANGKNGAKGSYKYEGKWESIDHILISPSLRNGRTECRLHDAEWLLEPDKKFGGCKPQRTFNGWKYNPKGCSDHLPVVLTIKEEKDKRADGDIFSSLYKNNIPFFLQEWKNNINFATNFSNII